MPGQIVLIVNGVVESDDGNVIGNMRFQMSQFIGHLDTVIRHVDERYAMEKADLNTTRTALMALTTTLESFLAMTDQDHVSVATAGINELVSQIREATKQITRLVPPGTDEEGT